ncbi:MAG: hypothetical protein Tsb0019_41810 [Roseibium sp.]
MQGAPISWTAASVENPVYVRDTRGKILQGAVSQALIDSFVENRLAALSDNQQIAIWKRFAENLSANAVYYDYGVGAVILRARISLGSLCEVGQALRDSKSFSWDAIDAFFEVAEIKNHFEELGRSLFDDAGKSPQREILAHTQDWKRLPDFGETAILHVSSDMPDGLPADENDLQLLNREICSYCGDISRAPVWSEKLDGVVDFCVGLSANALIVSGSGFSFPVNLIQMLEVSIMNLSLLNEFTTDQREILRELSFDKRLSKTLENKVEHFEDLGTLFDTVEYDLAPANYIANGYEGLIFQNLWNGWRGNELSASFQTVKSAYKAEVEKAKSRIARNTASKVSTLALTFTIISLGGFIAALISLYDIDNTIIDPEIRIAVVFLGIFCFGFLTGLVTLNLASVFHRPRKLEID